MSFAAAAAAPLPATTLCVFANKIKNLKKKKNELGNGKGPDARGKRHERKRETAKRAAVLLGPGTCGWPRFSNTVLMSL